VLSFFFRGEEVWLAVSVGIGVRGLFGEHVESVELFGAGGSAVGASDSVVTELDEVFDRGLGLGLDFGVLNLFDVVHNDILDSSQLVSVGPFILKFEVFYYSHVLIEIFHVFWIFLNQSINRI